MSYTPIVPKGSAPPLAPYSPGARAGNVVYVSGTLAIDKDGKTVGPGDAKAQTRFILESIKSVLEAAGGSLQDIAFNQIFLKDLKDYAAMNEVFLGRFGPEPGVRTTIAPAGGIPGNSLVEIDCIAAL